MRTLKISLLALAMVAGVTHVSFAQFENVGANGKPITNEAALAWTGNYMSAYPDEAFGHVYGKKVMHELLNTEGIAGVYIFNGLDGNGNIKLIFKAANDQ